MVQIWQKFGISFKDLEDRVVYLVVKILQNAE